MGSNRWAHLMFVGGGLVLAFLMVNTTEWIWSYFAKPKGFLVDIIGIGLGALIAFVAWRHKPTFTKATEITTELKKVTWPTRKETQAATIVVIITVIIASAFLGVFDLIWSWATGLLYS
jgi:preprotein translocase SecE subunit